MNVEKIESLSYELSKLIKEIIISGEYEYSRIGGDIAYVKYKKGFFAIPISISHKSKEINTNFKYEGILKKADIRFKRDRQKAYNNAKRIIIEEQREHLSYQIADMEKELLSLKKEYEKI